jgi:hypothetical protein
MESQIIYNFRGQRKSDDRLFEFVAHRVEIFSKGQK